MRIELDCHCHTIASGHAYSTIKEYAQEAKDKDMKLIAITEHAPMTPGMVFGDLYFLNFPIIDKAILGVELMTGVELNILNTHGDVDLSQDLVRRLDVVIASLHQVCIAPSSKKENTKAIIETMKNPYLNIIGHPGDPRYPICVDDIVKAASDYHVALELNEASCTGYRAGGEVTMMEIAAKAKAAGVPIVFGSDAHFYTALGRFDNVIRLSEKAGLNEDDILNTSVERFKAFIAK